MKAKAKISILHRSSFIVFSFNGKRLSLSLYFALASCLALASRVLYHTTRAETT
jgi:hypothetical protein